MANRCPSGHRLTRLEQRLEIAENPVPATPSAFGELGRDHGRHHRLALVSAVLRAGIATSGVMRGDLRQTRRLLTSTRMTFRRHGAPLGGLLLGAAISIVARPSAACSCADMMLLSPLAGSTDVPLNATLVVQADLVPVALYDVDQDVEVPATIDPFTDDRRAWVIHPKQLLRPNATFEVRFAPPIQGGSIRRFTTGTTTDDEAPSYGGITSFRAESVEPIGNSCRTSCGPSTGPFRFLKFDYPPPPADTSLLLLEARSANTTTVTTIPLALTFGRPDWPRRKSNSLCDEGAPPFQVGEEICARIIAFDMAGHRSEPSPEICTRVAACAPPAPGQAFCSFDACTPLDPGDASADAMGARDADPPDADPPDVLERDRGCGCSLARIALRTASPRSRAASALSLVGALAVAAAFARRRG